MTLRPELDSRWAQLMQNLQIGNPQAIADLFSRDIVYVTPDLPTIRNSSGTQRLCNKLTEDFGYIWVLIQWLTTTSKPSFKVV